MKKVCTRLTAVVLVLLTVVSCVLCAVVPVAAATYRNGAQSGPSASYAGGRYYSNYKKVPITGDNRTDLLAIALSQLGYQEGASNGAFSGEVSGSANYVEMSYNMGDLGLGYGGSDYPWCASFVSWCLYQSHCTDQGTYKSLGRYHSGDYDYIWKEISCSMWVKQLKGAGYFKYSAYEGGSYTPKSGDLVYFQNSKGVAHIGVCLYTLGGRIYTVEGNTSDSSGLEANGGGVYFKNYSLSSSYLYGYGVLPYKSDSSVADIDYSGANPTPGLYVANASKYIYSSETATSHSYVIPRFSMFEITKIGTNNRLYGTFTDTSGKTVTGWVTNNSDRIIQLSSTEGALSAEDVAREQLQSVVDVAADIRHYNYAESTISQIRSAYTNALSLLSNTAATESQLKSAATTLSALLAQTGSNTIALNNKGVYISGRNSAIQAGDCHVYSYLWNDGLITVDNANIRYTVNVVVQWSPYLSCNVVKSVTEGTGSTTPSIQLQEGEWLIAAHDWENGVSAGDGAVEYSGTNYEILASLQPGSRVYMSGATILNSGTDIQPGAFIKFGPPDSTKLTGENVKTEKGEFVLYTPDFNQGLITHSNANIHKTLNIVCQWDDSKGAWMVKDKIYGNGMEDETSNIEIVDGQVVIAGYAWESGVTDGTGVAGSTGNWAKLDSAQIGEQVIFSGISPTDGTTNLSVSANVDFIEYAGSETEGDEVQTGPVNLALGKSYEAQVVADAPHNANLTDGQYAYDITTDGTWFGFLNKQIAQRGNTNENGEGIVTIDLGARYNLDEIKTYLYNQKNSASIADPMYIDVYVSNNGTDFVSVGSMTMSPSATDNYWASLADANTNGRYVRLVLGPSGESAWIFLNEIEVYGTDLDGSENIALNTTQILTPAGDTYNTSLVDGVAQDELTSDNWFGFLSDASADECNTTDGVGTAIIDLGGRFRISQVNAHLFAGENTASVGKATKVTVSVSVDGASYAKVGTMDLSSGANAPYWATLTTDDAVGRYVRLEIEGSDLWTLINEIEVYGVSHIQTADNNIALEKTCTVPSFADSPYTASLTDGIASNIFQYGLNNSSWFGFLNTGDLATGNVINNNGIAVIDLGGQAEITGTSVHLFAGANDVSATSPNYINVYISSDGESFDYLETITPDATKTAPYWATLVPEHPVYARYIKYAVNIDQGDFTLLNEIKVSGTILTGAESEEPGSMSSVTLAGTFNNWNATPNMKRLDDDTVSVSLVLEEGQYQFKILDESVWYGNNGVIENSTNHNSEIGWEMTETADNCTLSASGGTYTFLYNTSTHMLRVLYSTDTYYIRGDFNGWGTWDILSENEDGTFSKTIVLDAGTYEYKAANEDYSQQWPLFNASITLDRAAAVTFTLDIFENTITTSYEYTHLFVTFEDYMGNVLSTQALARGESAQAPEAPARNGYAFSGWSKDFGCVTEDMTVKAQYKKTHGTLKVDITGGTGFTLSIAGGTARPQSTSYTSTRTLIGAYVTMTALDSEGKEFIAWMDPANGQILSRELTYSFYTSGNDYLIAMFETPLEGAQQVTFMNDLLYSGRGAIVDSQYYTAEDVIEFPAIDPQAVGFDFMGWEYTAEEIAQKVAAGEDVVVNPVWQRQQVYCTLEVTGGKITSGTMKDGKYLANSKIVVTANTPESGMKFAYWTDGTKVLTYESEYAFYPSSDMALAAVFIDENDKIDYEVLVAISNFIATEYGQWNFSWCVPEEQNNLQFAGAGILATNKNNYNEETFLHGTTDTGVYDRLVVDDKAIGSAYWIGPVASGETWVAKAWVQYVDLNTGEMVVVHSDLFTCTKD